MMLLPQVWLFLFEPSKTDGVGVGKYHFQLNSAFIRSAPWYLYSRILAIIFNLCSCLISISLANTFTFTLYDVSVIMDISVRSDHSTTFEGTVCLAKKHCAFVKGNAFQPISVY